MVDERARLEALRGLRILDTPPEAAYEALVREASRSIGVPIALISLMDEDRQWFKARVGIDAFETPRRVAFCHYAIADDEGLFVEDALEDPRFSGNPLVRGEPHVRFYGGLPLRTPEGHRVGTLCLIDREPRTLGAEQRRALEALRDRAEALLAARRG